MLKCKESDLLASAEFAATAIAEGKDREEALRKAVEIYWQPRPEEYQMKAGVKGKKWCLKS